MSYGRIFFGITLLLFCIIAIVFALVYFLIQSRGKESRLPQRQDAAPVNDPKVHLVANRLRPHFINNVLSSIYYLCETDTARAQKLTTDLSGYLLNTFASIEDRKAVPFLTELKQIHDYIALERLRFEDRLKIDYDIDVDDFTIPPLTVLALVENAVKRGIGSRELPGCVVLSTRRTASGGVQISVSDDGLAIEEMKAEHAAEARKELETVRLCLQKEAAGDLEYSSTAGEGTRVLLTLPPA